MISVILPAYNAADTIQNAVDSILKQKGVDFELIAIDDGSEDETRDMLRHAVSGDCRVNLLERHHEGLVASLHAGIEAASGEYLARMDADDVSHPTRLLQQVEWLDERRDVGAVSCLVAYDGDRDDAAGYVAYVDWVNTVVSEENICLSRFIESPIAHPSIMFRRELIQAHGGYRDGDFPEDYELWLRWMEQGVRFAKVPEVLLTWSDHPNRLSRTDERYGVDAFYRCKSGYLARWLAEHNPHHPNVIVWGAGRATRKRADLLRNQGIVITHYVDIDVAKIGQLIAGIPVISPDDLPDRRDGFVLPYVGSRGARELIETDLEARGFQRGKNYISAA